MLGKVNSNIDIMAFDEDIIVENEGIEHIVKLKFSRKQFITLSSVSQKYIKDVLAIMSGELDTEITTLDKEFLEKVGTLIDLSFIKGEDSDNRKVNTILSIYDQMKSFSPR